MELHRLRCGIIYSRQFADYLHDKQAREAADHPGELLSLEYVRCAEGAHAGTAWWQMAWVPRISTPTEHCLMIGDVEVFIHRQSRRGLRNHLLHYADGRVVVKQ